MQTIKNIVPIRNQATQTLLSVNSAKGKSAFNKTELCDVHTGILIPPLLKYNLSAINYSLKKQIIPLMINPGLGSHPFSNYIKKLFSNSKFMRRQQSW